MPENLHREKFAQSVSALLACNSRGVRTRTDGDAYKICIGGGRFLFQQKSHGLLREYPVVSVRRPTGIDGADFFIAFAKI